MPRLGTESNSSRRYNPQPHPSLYQTTPQNWNVHSDPPKRGESSSSAVSESSDSPDDLVGRSRASNSRTRWNARISGSPYGSRPLSRHLSADSHKVEEMDILVNLVPGEGSDDDDDVENLRDEGASGSEVGDEDEEEDAVDASLGGRESEPGVVDLPHPVHQHHDTALSGTANQKREKNKKKRAKARAKEKEKEELEDIALDALALAPHDLLASMSRIAKLIDSLNAGASANDPRAILRRLQDTLLLDGREVSPERWRDEVLQSVRRMEGMLGQIDKWQSEVAPAEIEALRQETARLEVRVRSVVEDPDPNQSEEAVTEKGKGKERASMDLVMEGEQASQNVTVLQPGTPSADSDGSVSDSVPDSSSCPSDSDTGPTEPDLEGRSPVEEKVPHVDGSSTPTMASPSEPRHPTPHLESTHVPLDPASEISISAPDAPSTSHVLSIPSLATKNHNIPPEPPKDPVKYLAEHPWSMLEVLLLLEVVAHFPPAEHGWIFITEAYNNLLITRPLQEWFAKQAAISNEEEVKMKSLLQKMNAEARQLRARPTNASAPAKPPAAAPAPKAKAGERGKAAQFGSAEAHAEADARAKATSTTAKPAASTPPEQPGTNNAAMDAQIVTRLPFPLDDRVPATGPPPAQRIIPFPRRRPPFTLPSEDAQQFTRIMRSATAGVRPPSNDSRAAMLMLYSATKSRFSVRSVWDCWHRWCTPWVVQDAPTESSEPVVVVVDYIAGNLGAPFGTSWNVYSQAARASEYRPVPGTYPDAPGVQHRVSARYDPRPGMVSFARMTHLTAEKYWKDSGLGRGEGGHVSEEVLDARKTRLPATLAGIWPGKGALFAGSGNEAGLTIAFLTCSSASAATSRRNSFTTVCFFFFCSLSTHHAW